VAQRAIRLLLLALAIFGAHASPAWAQVQDCFRGYRRQLRTVLGKEEADSFFKIVGAFSPEAQRGSRAILEATGSGEVLYDTLFETLERVFPPGTSANAFRTDEELFEVLGGLADEGTPLRLREGLDRVIGDLGSLADGDEGFRVTQGAIFDLAVAKRLAADGADYSQIVAFKRRFPAGDSGLARDPDIITKCGGCPDSLLGIHHENKNWTSLVFARVDAQVDELVSPPIDAAKPQFFKYTDVKVNTLASEFARDILIHNDSAFQYYRINLGGHTFSTEELSVLRSVLAKQFESPLVTAQLTEARRNALRAEFLQEFETIVTNLH
jgi:hypothetical protein